MKKKLPSTSIDAYRQAEPMIEDHHAKIISSLQVLGQANYETIAAHCKLERHQIGRRLSELERSLIVFKPGTKTPTKSGRMAFNYCLTEQHTLKVQHPAKQLMDKTKEAQEFLTDLQGGKLEPKNNNISNPLFL